MTVLLKIKDAFVRPAKAIWCEHSGAIHTSELDRSEIDLSPKRSECER